MIDLQEAMRDVLGNRLYQALKGRGHCAQEMASMSANERFKEFCAWELGDPSWGPTLVSVWEHANFDESDQS